MSTELLAVASEPRAGGNVPNEFSLRFAFLVLTLTLTALLSKLARRQWLLAEHYESRVLALRLADQLRPGTPTFPELENFLRAPVDDGANVASAAIQSGVDAARAIRS